MLILASLMLLVQSLVLCAALFLEKEALEDCDLIHRLILVYLIVTPIFALSVIYNG